MDFLKCEANPRKCNSSETAMGIFYRVTASTFEGSGGIHSQEELSKIFYSSFGQTTYLSSECKIGINSLVNTPPVIPKWSFMEL